MAIMVIMMIVIAGHARSRGESSLLTDLKNHFNNRPKRQLIHSIQRPCKYPEKPANEATCSEIVAVSRERISTMSSLSVTAGMCVYVLLPFLC